MDLGMDYVSSDGAMPGVPKWYQGASYNWVQRRNDASYRETVNFVGFQEIGFILGNPPWVAPLHGNDRVKSSLKHAIY